VTAGAADTFYLGTWKIASALTAPWADASRKPDEAERSRLVGKVVTIKPGEITGPRAVACKGPKYQLRNDGPEMLFQGMLDEMRRRDSAADPRKLAGKLGFQGSSWKTLETGCGNELELHFVDAGTAEFGLNNYVYVLKKE
jgi:hypothetical protein